MASSPPLGFIRRNVGPFVTALVLVGSSLGGWAFSLEKRAHDLDARDLALRDQARALHVRDSMTSLRDAQLAKRDTQFALVDSTMRRREGTVQVAESALGPRARLARHLAVFDSAYSATDFNDRASCAPDAKGERRAARLLIREIEDDARQLHDNVVLQRFRDRHKREPAIDFENCI